MPNFPMPTMEQTVEVLLATRDILADKEHWTCRADAKTKDCVEFDGLVEPWTEEAYSFCLRGAVRRAAYFAHVDFMPVLGHLTIELGHDSVTSFNDTHRHDQVMDLLDTTIRRLKDTMP